MNEWTVPWLLFYAVVMVFVVPIVLVDATKLTDYLAVALTILAASAVMLGPFVAVKWLTIWRSKQRTLAADATAAYVTSSMSGT